MALKLDYVTRETLTNLRRNLLLTTASMVTVAVSLSMVGVAFFVHDVSDDGFESAAVARIKFIQRFGALVGDGFHECFIGNRCAVRGAVLQSWIQHKSLPNEFLSFLSMTLVCVSPILRRQPEARNRGAHRLVSRSNP